MSDRISQVTLPNDYVDGEILYGEDVNKIILLLRTAVNANKEDLDILLTGSSSSIVKYSTEALEAVSADVGTLGFVYTDDGIKLYRMLATGWHYIKIISLLDSIDNTEPEVDAIKLDILNYTEEDYTEPGTIFYDSDRRSLVYITELGEYLEVGSNLGDIGKNLNNNTWEGQCVVLDASQTQIPIKTFDLADASNKTLSMVGVLKTSTGTTIEGRLDIGEVGKIAMFGDVDVTDFAQILDSDFLTDSGFANIESITAGTKLYLSATEAGKYAGIAPSNGNTVIWVATLLSVSNVRTTYPGSIFVYPQVIRSSGASLLYYNTDTPETFAKNDVWIDPIE